MVKLYGSIVTHVLSSDGLTLGEAVGTRHCQLSGCSSMCVGVRWPDGKITWPCLKGMKSCGGNSYTLQIERS